MNTLYEVTGGSIFNQFIVHHQLWLQTVVRMLYYQTAVEYICKLGSKHGRPFLSVSGWFLQEVLEETLTITAKKVSC